MSALKFYKNGQWEMDKCNLKKDNKPHLPKSPKDSAHDISEENSTFGNEMSALTDEEKKQLLAHLRTLRSPGELRNEANRSVGKD